jgi:hypothetical protein
MKTAATLREWEELMDGLECLADDMRRRRPPLSEEEIRAKLSAIARLHFAVVGLCPICDEPMRACDRRRKAVVDDDEDRLAHIPCLEPR